MKGVFLLILCTLPFWGISQRAQIEIVTPPANVPESIVLDSSSVLFSFSSNALMGEYGVETDGEFIYVTQWHDDSIAKYNMTGTIMDRFMIPGVGKVRDMAYDGQYYYGSPNKEFFYVIDMDNKELIDIVYTSFRIRGMAYDPVEDVFWANEEWSARLYKIDKQGFMLDSFLPANASLDYITGLAYDDNNADGKYLWGFSVDGSGAMLVKYDLLAKAETEDVIDISGLVAGSAYAAGLFIHETGGDALPTLGGILQGQIIFGIDLNFGNISVGIEDQSKQINLPVYPNPARDILIVDTEELTDDVVSLCIMNLAGQSLIEYHQRINHNRELSINVAGLKAGMYVISMQDASGHLYNSRFIKAD